MYYARKVLDGFSLEMSKGFLSSRSPQFGECLHCQSKHVTNVVHERAAHGDVGERP